MKQIWQLILIGLVSGTVLAAFLIGVYLLTSNEAYYLLFNVDYIPILKDLQPKIVIEITFHYLFCVISVVGLYFILSLINRERRLLYYVAVYALGSATLFFLTGLSTHTPACTDGAAWIYWSIGHVIYGFFVGFLIEYWIKPKSMRL